MEVTIGIQNAARELVVETHSDAATISSAVETALSNENGVFRITDVKGRTVLIPSRALGWVQVGTSEKGKVGFGAT